MSSSLMPSILAFVVMILCNLFVWYANRTALKISNLELEIRLNNMVIEHLEIRHKHVVEDMIMMSEIRYESLKRDHEWQEMKIKRLEGELEGARNGKVNL